MAKPTIASSNTPPPTPPPIILKFYKLEEVICLSYAKVFWSMPLEASDSSVSLFSLGAGVFSAVLDFFFLQSDDVRSDSTLS